MTTPTQVPAQLFAGDTWEWTRDLADYPAGTWTSVAYFEKVDGNFSVAGVASGTTHTFTIAAATSAGYRSGNYRWRLVVTAAGVRTTAEEGYVEVLPDPAAAGNVDHRSTARVMLENVEAYLRDPGNLRAASYSLAGRSLSRWSRADLIAERSKLQAQVAQEERAEKIRRGEHVARYQTRF